MIESAVGVLSLSVVLTAARSQSIYYPPQRPYDVYTSSQDDYLPDSCYSRLPRPPAGGLYYLRVSRQGVVSLDYSCKAGYKLVGESQAVITCDGGRWPSSLPSCKFDIQSCYTKLPPSPYFGYVTKKTSDYQVTARYTCEKGYKLVGPSLVTCTAKSGLRLDGDAEPDCFLDVNTRKTCKFTSFDKRCQYLTDNEKPIKWMLQVQICKRKRSKFSLVTKKKPILAIRLRNSSTSVDPLLEKLKTILETPTPTPTKQSVYYHRYARDADSNACTRPGRRWTAILKLQPSLVKRATDPGVIVDSVLEVGLLRNSVAHFIKFRIEAPLHAVVYGLEVFGHCLPDPPGSLYPVYRLPPSPHSAVDRDFCIRLRNRVHCRQGTFDFFVRIRFLALFRPSIPSNAREVRMTPKGTYLSVCDGFGLEDN